MARILGVWGVVPLCVFGAVSLVDCGGDLSGQGLCFSAGGWGIRSVSGNYL